MDVKIKYDKLFSAFEKMMEPYSNLDHTEKSYDYWVQEKGRYVDFDVINFYHDIDEDFEYDDRYNTLLDNVDDIHYYSCYCEEEPFDYNRDVTITTNKHGWSMLCLAYDYDEPDNAGWHVFRMDKKGRMFSIDNDEENDD